MGSYWYKKILISCTYLIVQTYLLLNIRYIGTLGTNLDTQKHILFRYVIVLITYSNHFNRYYKWSAVIETWARPKHIRRLATLHIPCMLSTLASHRFCIKNSSWRRANASLLSSPHASAAFRAPKIIVYSDELCCMVYQNNLVVMCQSRMSTN